MKNPFKQLFKKRECKHLFRSQEVCDLDIDPKCVRCDTPLSKCEDQKHKLDLGGVRV